MFPGCEPCLNGKFAARPFPSSTSTSKQCMDLIHSDVCGSMQTATPSGNRWFLTLIDDFSRFTVVRLLQAKREAEAAIREYVALMQVRFQRPPTVLRSDNGREYLSTGLKDFLQAEGTTQQTTVPYTPQQNGIAERKNRSLVEMARCMLTDAGLPIRYWGEAIITATYLQNCLPSRAIPTTPFERFHGHPLDVSHIRVFGSPAFSLVPPERRRNWSDRAVKGVLIGYGEDVKGWKMLDLKTGKTWFTRTVEIIEDANVSERHSADRPASVDTSPLGPGTEDSPMATAPGALEDCFMEVSSGDADPEEDKADGNDGEAEDRDDDSDDVFENAESGNSESPPRPPRQNPAPMPPPAGPPRPPPGRIHKDVTATSATTLQPERRSQRFASRRAGPQQGTSAVSSNTRASFRRDLAGTAGTGNSIEKTRQRTSTFLVVEAAEVFEPST